MSRQEDRADFLSKSRFNELILSCNESTSSNYCTAQEWIEEHDPESFEECSPEEIQAMKDTNTIWRLQIYPDTPIGFYVWYGATMESVVDAAIEELAYD